MAVYRATSGDQVLIDKDTTLRMVGIAADGTISDLYVAAYDLPPPLAFSAQPALVSGTTLAYGTYDPVADDVVTEATASASVTVTALLREAANTLITAGVTASSTQTLVERVLVASQVTTPVASTMLQVEGLLAQIAAFPTVSDILVLATPKQAFIFTAQPTAQGTTIHYGTADTGADDVVSSADAAVSITEVMTRVERALVTVQAVPTVADMMAQIDAAAVTAHADATVTDQVVRAVVENLVSAADALTTVAGRQIMVNGAITVAQTSADLTAVMRYLEGVTVAATARSTVSDVLTALLDVGPHVRIDINSPITRSVDVLSPITRTVDITSKVRLAA